MSHLPAGWREVELGQVCEIVSGATPKTNVQSFWGGDIHWATPKDLSDLGEQRYLRGTPRTLTKEGLDSCGARVLPAGSVLLSSRAPIGLTAINAVPVATNQGFKSLVPSQEVDAEYLYWWVTTNRSKLEHLGRGATFKEVSKSIVAGVKIPLPPRDEQKRIAAILDKIEDLRAQRHAALEVIDTLTSAIFLDMFGNTASRDQAPLGDIATLITKGTTPTSIGFDFASPPAEVGFVRAQDLAGGTIDESALTLFVDNETDAALARSRLLPRDVLISIAGTIGRAAIVPPGAGRLNCNQAVALVRGLSQVTPQFLLAWLQTDDARRQMLGSQVTGTISNLSLGRIKELRLPVPTAEEQSVFEARLHQATESKIQMLAHQNGFQTLAQSLQVRAFRGEL